MPPLPFFLLREYYFMDALTIIIIGLSGLIAQVSLLRELLIACFGNELIIGIIFASWIIPEALGVYIIGRFAGRIKDRIALFTILETVFLLALPLSIYLARVFKGFFGVTSAEAIGLTAIFFGSLLVNFLVAFPHGALFSLSCLIFNKNKDASCGVAKIYALETVGTLLGGAVFTYLLIPYFNIFAIAFFISLFNIAVVFLYLRKQQLFRPAVIIWAILISSIILLIGSNASGIDKYSLHKQHPKEKLISYRNSVYGQLVVARKFNQVTFFYNGLPVITAPYPDLSFVQEFGNFPLLFCPNPKSVLILSSGAGGLLQEILNSPVDEVDYAELDPLIIEMAKQYFPETAKKEFYDPRLRISNTDAIFFLKSTYRQYDVILVGLRDITDLLSNRLFTEEFFSLVKGRLKPGGVFSFSLPGSMTHLSKAMRRLNSCVLNALNKEFDYVRVIPGDYNIFLGSQNDINKVGPEMIMHRIKERSLSPSLFVGPYIEYRLSHKWYSWFMQLVDAATDKINKNLTPFAVYQSLLIWNRQFPGIISSLFESLGKVNLAAVVSFFAVLTLLLFLFYKKRSFSRVSFGYAIFTSGFFGMLVNLILIFSYQVYYGYLYNKIGLLISIFMTGLALGSILTGRNVSDAKSKYKLLVVIDFLAVVFAFSLPFLLTTAVFTQFIFVILLFICGLLVGSEFPLANTLYHKERESVSGSVGALYALDLLGGCFAGIFAGVLFLPVLGLNSSCFAAGFLKAGSFVLLTAAYLLSGRRQRA